MIIQPLFIHVLYYIHLYTIICTCIDAQVLEDTRDLEVEGSSLTI